MTEEQLTATKNALYRQVIWIRPTIGAMHGAGFSNTIIEAAEQIIKEHEDDINSLTINAKEHGIRLLFLQGDQVHEKISRLIRMMQRVI